MDFSYSDLVDARVGVIPKYNATEDSKKDSAKGYLNYANEEDNLGLIVSALVKPIDGVQVSASYAMNPGSVADGWCNDADDTSEPEHGWAMAANVNITDIIGIDDWSVGVEVTYVGIYNQTAESAREGLNDDIGAIIAATVYGGWQFIDAGVEYGIAINPDSSLTERKESENISFLTISANMDLEIGDMEIPVSVWFGSSGLEEFGDAIYVGASASYVYKGVGFGLGLEYAGPYAKTNNMQYGVNSGDKGVFAIIPSVSLASRQNKE